MLCCWAARLPALRLALLASRLVGQASSAFRSLARRSAVLTMASRFLAARSSCVRAKAAASARASISTALAIRSLSAAACAAFARTAARFIATLTICRNLPGLESLLLEVPSEAGTCPLLSLAATLAPPVVAVAADARAFAMRSARGDAGWCGSDGEGRGNDACL